MTSPAVPLADKTGGAASLAILLAILLANIKSRNIEQSELRGRISLAAALLTFYLQIDDKFLEI